MGPTPCSVMVGLPTVRGPVFRTQLHPPAERADPGSTTKEPTGSPVAVAACWGTASHRRPDREARVHVMAEDNTNRAGTEPDVAAAAISDGAYTLFVADFNDTDTAWAA